MSAAGSKSVKTNTLTRSMTEGVQQKSIQGTRSEAENQGQDVDVTEEAMSAIQVPD